MGSRVHKKVDPIFAAIGAHHAAYMALNAIDGDQPGWDDCDKAEVAAWKSLVRTEPTTLAGVAEMTAHLAKHPEVRSMTGSEGAEEAFKTIAAAVAHIAAQLARNEDTSGGLDQLDNPFSLIEAVVWDLKSAARCADMLATEMLEELLPARGLQTGISQEEVEAVTWQLGETRRRADELHSLYQAALTAAGHQT